MILVRTQDEFKDAVFNKEPEILVANDIILTSMTNIGYTLDLKGEAGASLIWNGTAITNRNLLNVTATGELVVESLILDGGGRDVTLAQVNGGSFIMNGGALLKNVVSTTANSAVKINGGSFAMNSGLITGISASDAVYCANGTVIMNNDAAVNGNTAAGLSMVQSTLTMARHSRISNNNHTLDVGGAGMIINSSVIMGIDPGDAPSVTGNRSSYYCGAWFFTDSSSLTMRYGAEISDNYAPQFCGGIAARDTVISMSGDAAIKGNKTDGYACGLMLVRGAVAILDGNAEISYNTCPGTGGGVFMREGAALQMKGRSSVHDNAGSDGAGIYLANASTSASIGLDNSSPSIFNNKSTGKGGGIFISGESAVELTGQADIFGNTAAEGNGIYKEGRLTLSRSPRILDGLFFDNISSGDELPVIAGALSESALIQLEASEYVASGNVPVVISNKGPDYERLGETDRAPWLIPPAFGPGYAVILDPDLEHVLIVCETYRITYCNVQGAENLNPDYYDLSDLPIILREPGMLPGHAFAGWYDGEGRRVTEIPVGTTGNITLIAAWEKLMLSFCGGIPCVCDMPRAIPVKQGEKMMIPCKKPCGSRLCFKEWNTSADGSGTAYAPCGRILINNKNITLYAQWQSMFCHYLDNLDN